MADFSDFGEHESEKVTLRLPEEFLRVAELVGEDDEIDVSKSAVLRYCLDRKFESEAATTEYDEELEKKIEEYKREVGIVSDEDPLDDVNILMSPASRDESLDFASTVYTHALRQEDEVLQEVAGEYIRDNFSDSYFADIGVEE